MIASSNILLQLDDIQSGVLRPRPTPYAATYVLLRIDDRKGGRELMRRLSAIVASAAHPESPVSETWVSVALTAHGLKALGLPQESLDSFSALLGFFLNFFTHLFDVFAHTVRSVFASGSSEDHDRRGEQGDEYAFNHNAFSLVCWWRIRSRQPFRSKKETKF